MCKTSAKDSDGDAVLFKRTLSMAFSNLHADFPGVPQNIPETLNGASFGGEFVFETQDWILSSWRRRHYMSCHDIGRGMAYVGSEVLRLYDEGKFDTDTAKRLLWATLKGVHWCDGNESEAAQSLDGRCAHCLRKVELPETELVFGDSREQNDRAASDFVWSLDRDRKILAPQV